MLNSSKKRTTIVILLLLLSVPLMILMESTTNCSCFHCEPCRELTLLTLLFAGVLAAMLVFIVKLLLVPIKENDFDSE